MRRLHRASCSWYFGLFALALAAIAPGCRANGDVFELQKESRMFEDEVYHLEAELEDCCRAKAALERENEDLRKQLAGNGGAPPSNTRSPLLELPGSGGSRKPRTEAPKLEAPTIELPEASDAPPATIPGDQQPGSGAGPGPLGSLPAQLSINKRLTGGLDRDNAGGDDGIMVMVEPRDKQGRLVKAPGAVSVVLMDPAQSGEATRVARWDFQANEVAQHYQDSTFGKGLQFELPWPADAPQNRNLQLFVRCTTEDGTKLNADTPVHIRLASDSRRTSGDDVTAEKDDEGNRKTPPSSRLKSRASRPSPRQARGDKPEWQPYR